jgi:uncharacterized protein Yka (UPF0111/DUF47 family)
MEPLDRIEQKLDKVLDKLAEHGEMLAAHGVLHQKNAEELEKHIKRTDLLEQHMDQEHKDMKNNLETALLPIKSFRLLVKIALGLMAIAGLVKLFIK